MGIIGRFHSRRAREAMVSRKHTAAKRTMKTIVPKFDKHQERVVSATKASKDTSSAREIISASTKKSWEQSAASTGRFKFLTDKTVAVSSLTEANIQDVVLDLLQSTSSGSCSVLVMANALVQSIKCKESHAKGAEDGEFGIVAMLKGEAPPTDWWDRRSNYVKEEMRRRYEWTETLDRLLKMPSSRDEKISSWEEAKTSLEKVLSFPSEDDVTALPADYSDDPIAKKYSKKLDVALDEVSEQRHNLSTEERYNFRTVISKTDQLRQDIQSDEDLNSIVQRVKTDLTFNATLRDQQEYYEKLRQSDAIKQLEERRKLKEARERAASLLRPLTPEQRQIVEMAVRGPGRGEEVIAQSGTDSVLRQSIRTLQPGQWLNDEVIHYFLVMLANRDEELCKKDPTRKRSHFYKSFFITKLLNEGDATCDGQYEYRNVKRWSKKVPGKDIFALDKIIFPVNMGNMHWICVVAFMTEKRIQVYDSMGSSGQTYLNAIFQYLKDEHMDKKKKPLPDEDQWQLIGTTRDTPQQRNGFDCGVFTCMFADFLSKDTPLAFTQEHINQCRERIALSIMSGKAIM
ncbi:Ulp1 protease family protein [Nitzschia inconspicua]|uniref:Ulp1 protease family protein n=1 Tax=Nitzschia inconspicua TaxID=303405 RepID=A0A9K3L5X2_9STRA|nr:Ulp1 protease family protein [Nitzschia inconspicua]